MSSTRTGKRITIKPVRATDRRGRPTRRVIGYAIYRGSKPVPFMYHRVFVDRKNAEIVAYWLRKGR